MRMNFPRAGYPAQRLTDSARPVARRVRAVLVACLLGAIGCDNGWAVPVTVAISGLEPPLAQNVRARLTLVQDADSTDPARVRYAHDLAEGEIRAALEPFGYYRPRLDLRLDQRDGGWIASYRVDPGEPLRLTTVDLRLSGEGQDDPALQTLLTDYPLKPGDRLDHALYDRTRRSWQNRMNERGYFDARFSQHQLRINLERYTAELILHLETGPRYRYDALTFNETPLNPALLQRFGNLPAGDPYQAASLLELQKNLLNSGFFAQADVEPVLDQRADTHIPVRVQLGMNRRNRYQAGAGYGVDTGPRLTLGYRNRYINRYGHSFQSTLRLSLIRSELDALYTIPLQDPVREQWGLSARLRDEDTEAGQSRIEVAGLKRSRIRWGLREVMSLDFHRETFDIDGTRTAFLLLPGLGYTWVDADNSVDTRNGMRLGLSVTGAARTALSDATFLRFLLDAKGIRTIHDDNRLIARAQLGYIATDRFSRLPLTQRFYAGGNNSVRGYRLNEISPLNARGQHLGGQFLLTTSLEYERTLWRNWGAAVFYDAGSAFSALRPHTPAQGAGLGVRWRSPFGPVRFDVALPLVQGLDPFQVYFMVGPEL